MEFVRAFITGGIICAIAQIFIDKTKLTPAKILVAVVCLGVLLTALGLYQPIVDYGGAGATVPLLGFGYSLANGTLKGVQESGFLGAFTGGLTAAAGGIASAVFFSYIIALIAKPKDKA
jgi:stage V sporulation protein AE